MPPESPPPDMSGGWPLPAGAIPQHGLRHPSGFAYAAILQAERQLRTQLPNPLADILWDEWHRQHENNRRQESLPPTYDSPSEPSSRRGSEDSGWHSPSSRRARSPARDQLTDLPPLLWPPSNAAPSGASVPGFDRLPAAQSPSANRPLPPNLPLCHGRLQPMMDPDENTVMYGSAAEYYGGSNMETVTSLDLVPWHVRRQDQVMRGNVRCTHAWLEGRGSRRHVVVFEKKAEEGDRRPEGDQEWE